MAIRTLEQLNFRLSEVQKEHPNWSTAQCQMFVSFMDAVEDLIPFCAKEMPKLGNKGLPEIVDIAGRQNELRKAVEKLEKLLKGVIEVKLEGKLTARGEEFEINVVEAPYTRLNQEAAKQKLDALGILDEYMDTGTQSRKTFKKIGPG